MFMSPQIEPEADIPLSIRSLREGLGRSREQMAQCTGYSARHIARWENGEVAVRLPYYQYLLSLHANTLGRTGVDFTFIDLFAGIGGFRKGFDAAGGGFVFTSEWDKYSQKTYRANFGDHEVHGDITKIDAADIPDHDILVAGFPCQPFSIAGVSKKNSLGRKHGFECETQGTLFFDIERIIAEKQPKAFLLENVKNLTSHDRGQTFQVIMRTLRDKLGYTVSPRIVDARSFVPQHRERIFLVGVRGDVQTQFAWDDVTIPDPAKGPRLKAILHPEDGSDENDSRYLDKRGRVLDKYVLSDHLWDYLQNYARKHQAKGNGFGFGLVGPDDVARTLSARYYKDGSEILVRRKRGNPRRLTPRECARLMGFDRPGQEPFKIVVSDTQAYKQFGNAVAVPVVEAIARALAKVVAPVPVTSVREQKRVRGVA
jgi:DNA (cytosine-5)-methyltransferase 1